MVHHSSSPQLQPEELLHLPPSPPPPPPPPRPAIALVSLIYYYTLSLHLVIAAAASNDSSADMSALLEFAGGIRQAGGASSASGGASSASPGCDPSLSWTSDAANDDDPCAWCGISCDGDGAVVSVQLAGLGLLGSLRPGSLSSLRRLADLDLSSNSLSGPIPEDLAGLSPTLLRLDLSGNAFTGPVPFTLGGLSALLHLSLASNRLQGPIPSSLGALPNLTSLNLSSNSLHNPIPLELSQIRSLQALDLHSNRLSGSIDPVFLAFPSLVSVDLSDNQLSGFLPWQPNDTLPLLKTLQYVNLSHNHLTGPLAPSKFSSIFAEKLRVLDMSHNELTGDLPDFEFVIELVTLRLGNNLFTGSVPTTLLSANLGLLEELDICMNNLTGGITRVLSSSLRVLNLSSNSLTGPIPQKIGSCSVIDLSHNGFEGDLLSMRYWSEMIEVIDLSSNNLDGKLIDDVSGFVRLRSFNVSHNALVGSIPLMYAKIAFVDLSFNQLIGSVPASFFNSSTLLYLDLSNNALNGSLTIMETAFAPSNILTYSPSMPPLVQNGPNFPLVYMDLSINKIEGGISDGIGQFRNMKVLDLRSNHISGSMPKALCNLTSLERLDLSLNEMTGPIPGELPSTLTYLSLSKNMLSGTIPQDLKRFPEASFFPGNEGLVSTWTFAPSPQAGHIMGSSHGGKHIPKSVKSGILIGGCSAGVALVLLGIVLVVIYPKVYQRFRDNNSHESRKSKSKSMWTTAPISRNGSSNLGSSTVLLQEASSAFRYKGSTPMDKDTMTMGSEDDETTTTTYGTHNNEDGTNKHNNVLKVQSPDRLSGDLHFLDKSLRFTPEELSRAPAEVLGRSSNGTSYKATLDSGHVLAVKWLREGLTKNKKEFAREVKRFAKIRHQNLNPLRGYYWGPHEHEKLVLSDFVSSGSLAAYFVNSDHGGAWQVGRTPGTTPTITTIALSWEQRLTISADIARGLRYLHDERHEPHGNLKASNVLIYVDGPNNLTARLSDYGLHSLMSKQMLTPSQNLNVNALGYLAPELASVPKPTFAADIYALGVLMLELWTGKCASDIISGECGVVDLVDWVKSLVSQRRPLDCFDQSLLLDHLRDGLIRPKGMDEMLALALRCVSSHSSTRPSIASIYDEISSFC